MESVLIGGAARRAGLLDDTSCRKTVDEHVSGRQNHGYLLYKMLQFALWYEAYFGSERD